MTDKQPPRPPPQKTDAFVTQYKGQESSTLH